MCRMCQQQEVKLQWWELPWAFIKALTVIGLFIAFAAWLCHAVGMVGPEEGAWPGPPPTTTSQPADHCGGQND